MPRRWRTERSGTSWRGSRSSGKGRVKTCGVYRVRLEPDVCHQAGAKAQFPRQPSACPRVTQPGHGSPIARLDRLPRGDRSIGRFPACHPWPCALPSTGVVSALPPSHAGLAMIHDSILGTIGRTPVVRLNRVAPANVELYAKVEAFNPGGSVTDRTAIAPLLHAPTPRPPKHGHPSVRAPPVTPGLPPSHAGLAMIHDSILGTIGRTPVGRLNRVAPANVELYAKVEAFNPGGSVKDRLAIAIILDAEARGQLKPGDTVIEATSGNTGVALAMVCAARGYNFVAIMTETFSIERRKLMRAYGAKVILTAAAERGTGMVRRAEELAAKHGWFLARQFENQANPAYHRQTTAAEILRDFAGRRIDPFVSGWGPGGTPPGLSAVLIRKSRL